MFVGHEAPAGASVPPDRRTDAGALAELPLEHLEHEITQLASQIYAGTCRWLLLVAEFDRRQACWDWGCHSTAKWLSWRCGLAPRAAREHVRVARSLGELPAVREAFATGELSFSKVRAITRVASPETEELLLQHARHATAAQLERIVRAYRGVLRREEAEEIHAERYVYWFWEDDGSLSFRGRVPAEDGALLLRALEAGRDVLRERRREEEGGSAEPPADGGGRGSAEPTDAPPPAPISNADALGVIAEGFLASPDSGSSGGGERYQVVVHVDEAVLARGDGDEDDRCQLADGSPLAAETARRLSCDSSVVRIVEDEGKALSVGRRTRTVPPALRRALTARDEGCRFPGCTNRRFLDAHHIHHWAAGGETSLGNLIHLCRRHHRLLHEGGFRVQPEAAGGFRFIRPDGRDLPASPALPGTRPGFSFASAGPLAAGAGERFDLDLTIDGLCQARAGPPSACRP